MDLFWEKTGWQNEDVHLSRLAAAPFRREFPKLGLSPGLFIIRGPRQVGKSSWLKTLLSETVQRAGADQVFFASCENLRDHLDLANLLDMWRSRPFFFLDEVTFVKDWSRAVKHFLDTLKDRIVVITGSNANDLRRGADTMPGRHGGGGEFHLLPMNFHEFCQARLDAGWIKPDSWDRIDQLRAFFQVGGFPDAVISAQESAKTAANVGDTLSRWLIGDATKLGKNETYLKETCIQILKTSQSPLSLQKLAQRSQMGSHHTALDYIHLLMDSYAVTMIYAIDPNTGAKRFRKDKKFYFRDPLIYRIAQEWGDESLPESKWDETLAEAVACEHFVRTGQRFGYFHSAQGEIDFYSQGKWAVEVKWSDLIPALSKAFKSIQVPHKKVWNKANLLEDFLGT